MSCPHGEWGECDICAEIDRAWKAVAAVTAERDALLAAKAIAAPSTLSVRKHPSPTCSVRYVMENGEELATCYGDDESTAANRIVAAMELATEHSALLTRVSELEAGLQFAKNESTVARGVLWAKADISELQPDGARHAAQLRRSAEKLGEVIRRIDALLEPRT